MQNPWKTLTNKQVYDNPWINISHREVLNPSGNPGIYGVVHFKNLAVGIVPVDADWNTWLVGQYRYTLDLYTWEIPEGGCPSGELALDAAKRELLEETGITALRWTHVLDMHTSNSVTDEVAIAYLAQDLTFGEAEPEDTEDLQVRKLPFDEVIDMVLSGEITDGLSVAALLQVEAQRKRGRFL